MVVLYMSYVFLHTPASNLASAAQRIFTARTHMNLLSKFTAALLFPCLLVFSVDACSHLPQCYSAQLDGRTACFPTWMRGYSQQQFEQLLASLRAFDSAWYGNCAGVCWIKQVRAALLSSSGC
jgi:hypothetical protein